MAMCVRVVFIPLGNVISTALPQCAWPPHAFNCNITSINLSNYSWMPSPSSTAVLSPNRQHYAILFLSNHAYRNRRQVQQLSLHHRGPQHWNAPPLHQPPLAHQPNPQARTQVQWSLTTTIERPPSRVRWRSRS
ncbi:hypothetical protein OF83DRAFT_418787 [Amylostereum chailletii]|nr:hypothetical protein OF83DRAFT_418787 [Amylostereum chailletii]